MFVKNMMRSPVITISPDETVHRAMFLMQKNRIRHLPVVDADDRVVGIVSSRDVRSAIDTINDIEVSDVFRLNKYDIREIMTSPAETTGPDVKLQDCVQLLADRKFGCLPVVDPQTQRIVGIVTETDILRTFAQFLKNGVI